MTSRAATATFRIFSYDDALPAYVFLPALVILLSLNALGALYAGFAAARALGADTPTSAAAWGAITGPAWAVTMAIAVLLAGGLFHGDAGDGSVLGDLPDRRRAARGRRRRALGVRRHRASAGRAGPDELDVTRPTGFEPVTSRSGGARSIH